MAEARDTIEDGEAAASKALPEDGLYTVDRMVGDGFPHNRHDLIDAIE